MRALPRPFEKVPAATSAPWGCICGRCEGEMIATHVALPGGEGFIGPDCVADIVALYGWVKRETHEALSRDLVGVSDQLAEARAAHDTSERRAALLEETVAQLTVEIEQLRSERIAVMVESERAGHELGELRRIVAGTANQRAAQGAVDAAAAGERPKQKTQEAA